MLAPDNEKMDKKVQIGGALRRLRKARRAGVEEVAADLGLKTESVRNLERPTSNVTWKSLVNYLEAIDC